MTVFPNFHPWGSFNPIVYRFRPHGSNPDECIHECMYFAPAPERERPNAPPIHWLGPDDGWVEAPELGFLAKVFNQDVANLPPEPGRAQAGSGIQLPWKPKGTRCGSLTRATGSPVKFVASTITNSLLPLPSS